MAAAKKAGGALDDAFVADVVEGLRLYHQRHGARVERLRMEMPINVRGDGEKAKKAGNQFVPARFEVQVFGSMLKGVDFVTSNLPGPQLAVYASGGLIEEIRGFGPLSGATANITLFSYRGSCGMDINSDRQAVPDPALFRACLEAGIAEVLAVA